MKTIYTIIIAVSIAFISCNDNLINNELEYDTINDTEYDNKVSVSQIEALDFVNQVSPKLLKTSAATTKADKGYKIEPIVEKGDTLLWIINYNNNQGYIILSAKRQRFPILAFNSEGNFDHRVEHNKLWIEEQIAIQNEISVDPNNTDNSYIDLWNTSEILKEGETITTEFEIDTVSTTLTRSIPERKDPINRQSVYPLCYPIQWGTGFGYHYEMPISELYFQGPCKLPVNGLVVSICHLMYAYWTPSKYGWMYMPNSIEQIPANDKSNLVASMFKDISTQLGVEYNSYNGCVLKPSKFFNLQSFWRNNDYSNPGEVITYSCDEESFLKVYNCLLAYKPVLFTLIEQINGAKRNWVIDDSRDHIRSCWVVDGYQEVKIKVTKKKRFLGIKVSEKVYYYYSDFFRFLYPDDGTYVSRMKVTGSNGSGWFQQDHNIYDLKYSSGRKYAIINIHP